VPPPSSYNNTAQRHNPEDLDLKYQRRESLNLASFDGCVLHTVVGNNLLSPGGRTGYKQINSVLLMDISPSFNG
jgi:hypothetical protein